MRGMSVDAARCAVSIVVPAMDRLAETRACWEALTGHTTGDYELIVVDNSAGPETGIFLHERVAPRVPCFRYLRNAENAGVWGSLEQGYRAARGEVVVFLHNDVLIGERGWNERLLSYFRGVPRLGLAGFHGCQGFGPAGRYDCWSNLGDAEVHGRRLDRDFRPVAVLDGFCLALARGLLEAVGGLDPRYLWYHHCYDHELSLASLAAGFRNIVVDVPCRHLGYVTSGSPGYRQWLRARVGGDDADHAVHHLNTRRLYEKWSSFLPVYVEDDFTVRRG